jgi:hypothetical protein
MPSWSAVLLKRVPQVRILPGAPHRQGSDQHLCLSAILAISRLVLGVVPYVDRVAPRWALRVAVYAGVDPITKKRHYLQETVPAGPKAGATAEKVRTRLLKQVDDRQAPRTNATVNQLLDRYVEMLDVEPTTRERYEGWRIEGPRGPRS